MSDLYKKLRNLVLSTTGCKVNNHAISLILAWQAASQSPASGEPVAFMVEWDDGLVDLVEGPLPAFGEDPITITPLFAHPPAKVPEGQVMLPSLTGAGGRHDTTNFHEREIRRTLRLLVRPEAGRTGRGTGGTV